MEGHNKKLVKIAIATIVAGGIAAGTHSINAAETKPPVEKCYGIAKKGMNECAAKDHSCQAQSTVDGDKDEWIYVLQGTCNKIVGGNTSPAKK